MLEGISADLVAKVGPTGLLTIVVLMVLLGQLIPRWQHRERIVDKNEQIANLQKTLEVRDEQIRVQGERAAVRDDQMGQLLAQSDLTVQLLSSLAKEAGGHGDLAV